MSETDEKLPYAFYNLLRDKGMPEGLTYGEQHAWLYRYFVAVENTERKLRWAEEVLEPLNILRENEGATVTLFCDNPDFSGRPNNAIEVNDDWTGWDDQRYEGDTLAEALESALSHRKKLESRIPGGPQQ